MAELIQIKGVTPALMEGVDGRRGLADVVSVWGSGQINVNTAGREVLRALGLSDAQFSRRRAVPAPGPLPSRPPGWRPPGVALSHNSRTFRIEALGLVDGQVRARLTAIVRKGANTGTDGITVLEWSGVR